MIRQDTESFLRCLENAPGHFGCAPLLRNLDNLKAPVLNADWFDPQINPKLAAFRRHSQSPLPRRPRVPDRVSAHEPGPARRRPRHRHGHSHLRRVSGFSPHLHALVADGLFARSEVFHVMPETGLKPLEELFRARVIRFLVAGTAAARAGPDAANWVHSGFNVHRGRRVVSRERKDMERLPSTSSATPFRSKRCGRPSQARLRHPDRSSTAPA